MSEAFGIRRINIFRTVGTISLSTDLVISYLSTTKYLTREFHIHMSKVKQHVTRFRRDKNDILKKINWNILSPYLTYVDIQNFQGPFARGFRI